MNHPILTESNFFYLDAPEIISTSSPNTSVEMSSISSGGWTLIECLALVHAILKYGDDNWLQVSKAVKTYQQHHYQNHPLYKKDKNDNNNNENNNNDNNNNNNNDTPNGFHFVSKTTLAIVSRDNTYYTPSVSNQQLHN